MKNNLNSIVRIIKNEKDSNMYKIVEKDNRFYIGVYNDINLKDTIVLNVKYKSTFMDDLLDTLKNNFDNLATGYTMDLDNIYEYYTIIDDSTVLIFPSSLEYNEWIINELKKEGKIKSLSMYKN